MNVQVKRVNESEPQYRANKVEHVRILELLCSEEIISKTGATFIKACVIVDRTFFANNIAYPSHHKEWVTLSEDTLAALKAAKGVSLVELVTRHTGKYTNRSIRGILN